MNYLRQLARSAFVTSLVPSEERGAGAAEYPNRPIRFIVPFAAGGPVFSSVTAVAAGELFTCALRSDGTVWCFGDNRFGQLG
ncbi:MAG: hypothetical protein AAB322_00935, partial [Pseudomonadota bacterium]